MHAQACAQLREIADAMWKLAERYNDVKDTAHQGRMLCESATSFLLAYRARPLPTSKEPNLHRELKHLASETGEDPPALFRGLERARYDVERTRYDVERTARPARRTDGRLRY